MAVQARMTAKQKAAVLVVALGPELSAGVLRHLREEEVEQLTLELASVRHITPEQRQDVLEEFRQLAEAQGYIQQGGIQYAKEVLEKALGPAKAHDIIQRLTASLQVRPFEFARRADPGQLLNFIQNEHPQTIALVMAYLDKQQAAAVLSALPPERQADVARRIAIMDRTSPEVVRELERILERKLSSFMTQGAAVAGGVQQMVDVLNHVDRGTEKAIMERLEAEDPALAEEIRMRMFTFDDIVLLDDRSLQRALREVDLNNDMPMALKLAGEEVKEKIFKNLSQRAVENLKENMEYLGPVRLRDAEEAQQRVVAVIRRLEEQGEIVISRGGEGDVLV